MYNSCTIYCNVYFKIMIHNLSIKIQLNDWKILMCIVSYSCGLCELLII